MLNGNFTNSGGIYYYLLCSNGTNIITDESDVTGEFTGVCVGNINIGGNIQPFEYDHINCQIHYPNIGKTWLRRTCNGEWVLALTGVSFRCQLFVVSLTKIILNNNFARNFRYVSKVS